MGNGKFRPIRISGLALTDITNPSSEATIDRAPLAGGWHTARPVGVRLVATDTGGSGVKEIRYTVDMGAELVVDSDSGTFNLDTDGIHTVAYWGSDWAGNTEATNFVTVKIDTTAPVVTGAIAAGRLILGASDNVSGVASIEYAVDNGPLLPYSGSVVLPAGAKLVRFRATDVAGNVSDFSTVAAAVFLKQFSVTPPSVSAGANVVVTATLAFPAPAGGLDIALTSDNPTALAPPAVLNIPAGATKASTTIRSGPVPTDTAVTLTARLHATSVSALVTVLVPEPKSLLLSPSLVTGGATATGTVTLSAPAPAGGQAVDLSSFDAAVVSVPPTLTVPEGALSATFPITTANPVSTRAVLVSASVDDRTVVAVLTVRPVVPLSLNLGASSTIGGTSVPATVTLSRPAPAGGIPLAVAYSNPALTGPLSVTVPQGVSTVTFNVQSSPVPVDTAGFVTVRAGSGLLRGTLRVLAPRLSSVSLSPSSVKGGSSSIATVVLTGPAPSGGVVVGLGSSSLKAAVPISVLVPAGATQATFPVTTAPVTANTTATITAARAGTSVTARLGIVK